jgi:hypothetical protein
MLMKFLSFSMSWEYESNTFGMNPNFSLHFWKYFSIFSSFTFSMIGNESDIILNGWDPHSYGGSVFLNFLIVVENFNL